MRYKSCFYYVCNFCQDPAGELDGKEVITWTSQPVLNHLIALSHFKVIHPRSYRGKFFSGMISIHNKTRHTISLVSLNLLLLPVYLWIYNRDEDWLNVYFSFPWIAIYSNSLGWELARIVNCSSTSITMYNWDKMNESGVVKFGLKTGMKMLFFPYSPFFVAEERISQGAN